MLQTKSSGSDVGRWHWWFLKSRLYCFHLPWIYCI